MSYTVAPRQVWRSNVRRVEVLAVEPAGSAVPWAELRDLDTGARSTIRVATLVEFFEPVGVARGAR